MVYGYIRVSSRDQCDERQRAALLAWGVPPEALYADRCSGKDFQRPQYLRLMRRLRRDDLLVVKSIDRLGRDYAEVMEQWRVLTRERGVSIVVLDMPLLDTRCQRDLTGTLIADIVLQLLSYVAQTEREMILRRQAEGIAAARARGALPGIEVYRHADSFDIVPACVSKAAGLALLHRELGIPPEEMAAVGDGGGSYYLPTADMTALVHEVWRGAIASKEINSKSSNMVDVKFVLPGTVGGFTAREAALIDDEGDMIAVCNLPDTEKAAIEDGIAAALTILMHIVMTNSDALTFTLDPTTDTASAVCVAFTIPHEAWQSAGGAEDDEGGGTYPCRADVVCDEATAMHTPIATLDKACLAAAKACELCPTVETASGVLRFWAMKVPDGELTGSVLLVGQGGGGKSGDGSYTLPTATPFRLGGVKVGDGLTVDNEGKLSVDAANTEETTGALNEVFGAEDGK